jgi:hypothetical protein
MRSRLTITRIGWIGLGLSILALALLILTGWVFSLAVAYAPHTGPAASKFFPWLLILTLIAFAGAVAVDIVAGVHGLGNRLLGILGGLIMLTPAVWVILPNLLNPDFV